MNKQTKTPGAMVLVSRELLTQVVGAISQVGLQDHLTDYEIADSVKRDVLAVLECSAEQPPAVGGEPITRWHPQKTPTGTVIKPHSDGDFVTLDDHRAHLAPLLAEIEMLNASYETVH